MTEREKEILAIIRENPTISQEELAFELGISRSGVAAHIHNLMKKGYIKGKGYIINNPQFISVIGGINIDIVGSPSDELLINNSNPGKINYYLGGAGRNIALALTKLRINTNLISVYGADVNGDRFIADSRKIGFNVDCCERISGYNTSSFIYLEDSTTNFRVGIDDMRILETMTPEFINRYLQRINRSRYCVIDDNLPLETIEHLEKQVSIPMIAKSVSMNKVHKLIPLLGKLELLVLSVDELEALAKALGESEQDFFEKMRNVVNRGVQNLVVVKKNGNVYFESTELSYQIDKKVAPEFNINGSTAVLTSTMIWAMLNGNYKMKEIVELGYCGAVTSYLTNDSVFDDLSEELVFHHYEKYFVKK